MANFCVVVLRLAWLRTRFPQRIKDRLSASGRAKEEQAGQDWDVMRIPAQFDNLTTTALPSHRARYMVRYFQHENGQKTGNAAEPSAYNQLAGREADGRGVVDDGVLLGLFGKLLPNVACGTPKLPPADMCHSYSLTVRWRDNQVSFEPQWPKLCQSRRGGVGKVSKRIFEEYG